MSKPYKQILDQKNNAKTLEIVSSLPGFVKDFFNHLHSSASRTKLSYAYNIKNFLNWILENNPELKNKELKDINIDIINCLDITDLDEYFAYMSTINTPAGLAQKSSALNSFFRYLRSSQRIDKNPMENIKRVKVEDKPIIKLDKEQLEKLMNAIENGWEGMTEHQKAYWQRDKVRDYAIIMLMLSTGIRVSECSCLNLDDVDIENCQIFIIRKGHKEKQAVYFNDETAETMKDYIIERKISYTEESSKDALFISDRGKRISVQTIENIVRKYTENAGLGRNYTPHKLRKTYGTNLYKETGDIYLVASALGHEDVETTTKHYVEEDSEKLKEVRNAIKIRKKG